MNVLIFGATGMVGQGALRECLDASDVDRVASIGRTPIDIAHPKFRSLIVENFMDYTKLESELQGFDACFFCLGVSSIGLPEIEYGRLTYGFTLAAARTLARLNPQMTFVYVSGAGTDSTEQGRVMWARVKGRTENALQRLPFKAVYMFRPGAIQPLHGIRSKTTAYRWIYMLTKPLLPLWRSGSPPDPYDGICWTSDVGRCQAWGAAGGVGNRRYL